MLFLIVLSRSFFDILEEPRFTFMVKRVFVTEMKPDTGQVTFCRTTVQNIFRTKLTYITYYSESKGGVVVRALASHQCGPGSNPGVDAICGLSLLLVLSLAPRVFSPGTPVFRPLLKNQHFQFPIRPGIR